DPDDLAVLAVHARLEVADRAARLDHLHELLAPLGLDVELPPDVPERLDQLLGRVVTVDPRKRRVRIDVTAVRRRPEDPFDRVLEKTPVPPLGFAQGLFRPLPLGYVLDQPLDRDDALRSIADADAALPDPAYMSGRVDDPVFDVETAPIGDCRVNLGAHACAVVRMNDLLVRDSIVEQQVTRSVSGHATAAIAHEFQRPIGVV